MRRPICKKIVEIVGVLVCTTGVVQAVTPAQELQGATNFSDPGRIGNQLMQSYNALPKAVPKPKLPVVAPPPTVESKIHLKLTKIVFKGNTVFSSAELQSIFAASINHTISLTELQRRVQAVTTKYRDAGYILSRAILPPQVIKGGVVQIQVIEGFVSNIVVEGDPGRSKSLLEGYARHIMQSKPLQIHTLERYALLANDIPGITVQSVLTPSKTVPAGADLTLVAKRERGTGFLAYDNFGTRFIGPLETSIGGSLFSVFAPGDVTAVHFTETTKPLELKYSELTHTQSLGSSGAKWQIGTNYAETRPQFTLTPVKIVGRNFLLFTDVSYPLIRSRNKNLTVHSTFNYQNVNATIFGFPFYQDRIRSLVVGAAFDNVDSWHGSNTLSLDVTHGYPLWGAHNHFYQSNVAAQVPYTRINPSLSRLQGINSRLSLLVAVHGQFAFESLLATEQFGVGGPDYGRGYDPSEIVGDKGVSGKVELRFDVAPGLAFLQSIQYYAFYDAGAIWSINTLQNSIPDRLDLTSAGVGARFNFMANLTGNFFIAKPLTKKVAVLDQMDHNPTSARAFFQISATI
ncbi:MAG: POTRA domain-containing protein [Gammaproteobacteria bacterium]|nr:POTRA domain-containing protein [Gammaproteobacteria bacterium]